MVTDQASAKRRAHAFSHVAKASWGKGVGTLWRIARLNLRHPWQVTICIVSTFIAATLQLFVPRMAQGIHSPPLGHIATMLNDLETTGGRFGFQTMCEGGGQANATVIERLD